MKRAQKTRIFVDGEDVSPQAVMVDIPRRPDSADTAVIEFFVDRFSIGEDGALEIYVST